MPLLTLAACLAGASAHAQSTGSVNDFKLPPGEAARPVSAQGPVDPDNPVASPTAAATTPAPRLPAPQSAPQLPAKPTADATAAATPQPTAAPPAPALRPSAAGGGVAAPQSDARRPSSASPTEPSPARPVEGTPAPAPLPQTSAPPAVETALPPAGAESAGAEASAWSSRWWIWAGLALSLALSLAMALLFFYRRRSSRQAPVAAPEASPRKVDPPPPAPTHPRPTPAVPAPPPVPADLQGIALAFEPERLTMAFFNARLAYRLTVSNRSTGPIEATAIAADLMPAHTSLAADTRGLFDGDMPPPCHRLPPLAPGETIIVTGELELPNTGIVPILSGNAKLFVPLVRFRLMLEAGPEAGDGARHTHTGARTHLGGRTWAFVIGEPAERPGGRLRPIRIDLGPRTYPDIDQRAVDLTV